MLESLESIAREQQCFVTSLSIMEKCPHQTSDASTWLPLVGQNLKEDAPNSGERGFFLRTSSKPLWPKFLTLQSAIVHGSAQEARKIFAALNLPSSGIGTSAAALRRGAAARSIWTKHVQSLSAELKTLYFLVLASLWKQAFSSLANLQNPQKEGINAPLCTDIFVARKARTMEAVMVSLIRIHRS